jgi:DNA-binding MarR family transcriptional regulator
MSICEPLQPGLLNDLLTEIRRMSVETMLLSAIVAERIGINPTDLTWLALIEPHREVTAGELAELSGLTTGAVTGLIDRLEKAGFVERRRDPDDRRKVYVRPNPGNSDRIEPHFARATEQVRELWGSYSEEQLLLLRDFFTRSHQILHEERVRLRQREEQTAS